MRHAVVLLVLILSVATAGEPAESPLKVDLDKVVEQGVVAPVDGITAAGQPDEAAFKVFADSGYVAVIDMRTAGEDRGLDEVPVVEGLGMEYVAFPIGKEDITNDKAAELDALLEQYDGPVLLHCGSANRVGALLALREFQATGDVETALEAGREGGMTRLEGTVIEVLKEAESAASN